MTSDKQERDLIEAAIREAHEQRAEHFVKMFIAAAVWIKKGFVAAKAKLSASHTPSGLGHTGHTA